MTAKTKGSRAKKPIATIKRETAVAKSGCVPQKSFSLISDEKLQALYATMLKCRMLEERMRLLIPSSQLAATIQEAAVAGILIDLLAEDALIASPRDLLSAFVKGAPMEKIFSFLRARSANGTDRKSHLTSAAPSSFVYAPANILAPSTAFAGKLNMATDLALANKIKDNGKIVVVFSGVENGSSACHSGNWSSVWLDALHFAEHHSLPILFVNQIRLSDPARRVARPSSRCAHFELPAIPVDGNDAVAVYRVAAESISRIRQGRGPTLVECLTLQGMAPSARSFDGNGADQDSDSVLGMENYLAAKGLFDERMPQQIAARFRKDLEKAVVRSSQ
jgi:pyruvate dehydrogenase E1 component alpha subunit